MNDQTRATMKALNQYLDTIKLDRFCYELVKGQGYFYFSHKEEAPVNTPEPPPSIYTCYLHQATLQQWKEMIDGSIDDWKKERGFECCETEGCH